LRELIRVLEQCFVSDDLLTSATNVGVHLVDDVALRVPSLNVFISLEDSVAKLEFVEFFWSVADVLKHISAASFLLRDYLSLAGNAVLDDDV